MSLPPAHRFRRCVSAYRAILPPRYCPRSSPNTKPAPRACAFSCAAIRRKTYLRDLRQGQLDLAVALTTLREGGPMHCITVSTLNQVERDYEIVFTAAASVGLLAAVSAGLGVALLGRREVPQGIEICDESFLPKPPEVYCGIYLRERLDCEMLEGLADAMADALRARPSDTASSRPEFDARWEAPADDGASRG
jgi:DNA-binding transcriptional LysR family regulator